MELEEKVHEHDEKLRQHDREIGRLNDNMTNMQKSLNEGLARVDESNKFLREQNTFQSDQNSKILQAVLQGNQDQEKRKDELKVLNWSNLWKVVGIAAGAGGVISAIVQILFNK